LHSRFDNACAILTNNFYTIRLTVIVCF